MDMQSAIVAQQAVAQQNVSMSVIKQAASVQNQVANMLAQSSATVPASASHGGAVNLSA